jgi:hypothetical protein
VRSFGYRGGLGGWCSGVAGESPRPLVGKAEGGET